LIQYDEQSKIGVIRTEKEFSVLINGRIIGSFPATVEAVDLVLDTLQDPQNFDSKNEEAKRIKKEHRKEINNELSAL